MSTDELQASLSARLEILRNTPNIFDDSPMATPKGKQQAAVLSSSGNNSLNNSLNKLPPIGAPPKREASNQGSSSGSENAKKNLHGVLPQDPPLKPKPPEGPPPAIEEKTSRRKSAGERFTELIKNTFSPSPQPSK